MNLESKKQLLLKAVANRNYPETLYKYRTIDQTKQILGNSSFWFADPLSFNDPFDCRLSEVKDKNLEDARIHFTRLGIDKNTIERSIDLFQRNPEKLSDLVKEAREKSILSKGILSLSEKYDDILMWSHYSDSHKGIVIGISMSADPEFFLMPIRIDYADRYEAINYLKDPETSTEQTLKLKSSHWKYEQEIRVYKSQNGLHELKRDAIVEIYFGVNTSEEDITEIVRLVKLNNYNNAKFYKGNKKHGEFSIEFNPLAT